MPITGLPTFAAGILTASQLNSIVTALEAKFAGHIVSGDLSWPLTAGGDIDMAQFQLLNVSKFWNAYNASEREAGSTLQDLIDDVSADGGGIVVIPGNFTENVPAAGITMPANVHLVGDGESSVLQMHASAAAAMVTFGTTSHNSGLINLKLNGVSSVNQIFVDLNSCDYVRLHGNHFATHGTQPFVKVRAAAAGTSIQYNQFTGNGTSTAQSNIQLEACAHTRILHNQFRDWATTCVLAGASGTEVGYTVVADNDFQRTSLTLSQTLLNTFGPILFNNNGGPASAGVIIVDNTIQGEGAGIGGIYVNEFDDVVVSGNTILANNSKPAVQVFNADRVVVNRNLIRTRQSDGIILGSTAGKEAARSAAAVTGFTVSGNDVFCDTTSDSIGVAFAMTASASPIDGCVTGNRFSTGRLNVMQMWNLAATPSVRPLNVTIVGNYAVSRNASAKGFASYTDMGTTAGGDIGTGAVSHWFTLVANTIPNTATGTDVTHSAANKCIFQDNNT